MATVCESFSVVCRLSTAGGVRTSGLNPYRRHTEGFGGQGGAGRGDQGDPDIAGFGHGYFLITMVVVLFPGRAILTLIYRGLNFKMGVHASPLVWNDLNRNIEFMEFLAIPGSVRPGSYNLALLKNMSKLSSKDTRITVFDRIKDIPIFDPDTGDDHIPEPVDYLMSKIRASDGVIISTPEYAHGVPGVIKNTLDWLVSSDAMVLKPVVVTSVSTSGLGGVRSHSPLLLILSAMNSNVVVEGSINVPYAQRKFDKNLNLIDEFTKKAIGVSLAALERAISNT